MLTSAEREMARLRVPERPPMEITRPFFFGSESAAEPRRPLHVLIVDADPEVERTVRVAFDPPATYVVEPEPHTALWTAADGRFDLILADARGAFGQHGFLSELVLRNRAAAKRVVLTVHEGQRELVMSYLDELRSWNSVLCKPFDAETLTEILRTGAAVQRWSPAVEGAVAPIAQRGRKRRRVVVIDDAPSIEAELAANPDLELVVTHDEWEAVDLVESDDVALVLCRIGMRTRGGTPLYRLLWNARPAIKRRFAFIASSEPTGESVPTTVIRCPLTVQSIVRLLDGIEEGEGSGGAPA
jgi:DNA-binding NarL/FixJ family response regulator